MKKLFKLIIVILMLCTGIYVQGSENFFKITASDGEYDDDFGRAVAIDGNYAVIGANQRDDISGDNNIICSGSAYVFQRIDSAWVEQAQLNIADRKVYAYLGCSVAIDGDYIVLGARGLDNGSTSGAGAAYIFKRTGSTWVQEAKLLAPSIGEYDFFGCSVDISGDYVAVGASWEDEDSMESNTLDGAGSVYIFKRDGNTWALASKLVAEDRAENAAFGGSLSISGDYLVVGASREKADCTGNNSLSGAGAAYIFKRENETWNQQAKLLASDRNINDSFGNSVAITSGHVIIGASYKNVSGTTAAGAVYIFKQENNDWLEEIKLTYPIGQAYSHFGNSVSICGNHAIAGCSAMRRGDNVKNVGVATKYVYENGSWLTQSVLDGSSIDEGKKFACSVDISDDKMIIGAEGDCRDGEGNYTNMSQGSAYIFEYTDYTFKDFALLEPVDSAELRTATPTFLWNSAQTSSSVSYTLTIKTPESEVLSYNAGNDTSYTLSETLSYDKQYSWRIIARKTNGDTLENMGGFRSFRILSDNHAPSQATLLSPVSTVINTLIPEFTWEAAIDEDDGDSLTYTMIIWNSSMKDSVMTEINSCTLNDPLVENSNYSWKVIASDKKGDMSESDTSVFWVNIAPDIPAAFTTLSPRDYETFDTTSVTLSWESATDPDPFDTVKYLLRYKATSATFWEEIGWIIDTSQTVDLNYGHTYEWQVIAKDLGDNPRVSDNGDLPKFTINPISGSSSYDIPHEYSLEQNYPNPFNPITSISYQIPHDSDTELLIYDLSGNKITSLIHELQTAGAYTVSFNASDIPSGVYLYRLKAGNFIAIKKMILMK